ncbi:hypothetical protein TNCV_4419061 [Trichonephila clavipes]|nr:hypothetical protein TNCV_4419061 [Trichonephila clavipes]
MGRAPQFEKHCYKGIFVGIDIRKPFKEAYTLHRRRMRKKRKPRVNQRVCWEKLFGFSFRMSMTNKGKISIKTTSRRAASPVVKLVEGEEKWGGGFDHPLGVLPPKLGWNQPKSYCHLYGAQSYG